MRLSRPACVPPAVSDERNTPHRPPCTIADQEETGVIEINESFDVPCASPREVWNLLSDPQAVVECVPGAALGEAHEDGSFDGSLAVKFGPAKVTFRARIEL